MKSPLFFILFVIIYSIAFMAGCQDVKTRELKELKIGGQVWSAQNLSLPTKGSWCINDCSAPGRFYTWEAAMRLADSLYGWRMPSENDWRALEYYLGSDSTEDVLVNRTGGKKLKNHTGFNLFPGSIWNGKPQKQGEQLFYWSSDTINYQGKRFGRCRMLSNGGLKVDEIYSGYFLANDSLGLSVRLIKVE